jgi:DNA replication protein DnaC
MGTSEIIKRTLEGLAPNSSLESTKNDFSEITLTTDEELEALRDAREKKFYRIQHEKYAEKVRAGIDWGKPTARDLYEGLKATFSKSGERYKITEHNKIIIEILCLYFSNDDNLQVLHPDIKHSKGICLTGMQGVGKTHLMNFFVKNPKASYMIPTCRDIAEKFRTNWEYEGINAIEYYSSTPKASQPSHYNQEVLGFCFGDLGTEEDKNVYGNKMNVMDEVFFKRYESGTPFHMTHFTTNLSGDEIKTRYGVRFYDRLKESCNWLVLKGESFR